MSVARASGPRETIVALSSGRPPSAIAIVRFSGPDVDGAMAALLRRRLPPRRACLATVRGPTTGETIDEALCLYFPEGGSATGEAVLEIHAHGGPAVVERLLAEACELPGVRLAEPGEFTLRAVLSGRMDLPAAEALAELIEARTEAERRRAVVLSGGALARAAAGWREDLVAAHALVEAALDFCDEGDVLVDAAAADRRIGDLRARLREALVASEGAERLSDGLHIVVAGPPNAGKSSLVNALAGTDAAIVSAEAGTTRDVISVPLVLGDHRVTLHDTAGVREGASGVEAIGIARTHARIETADLVLEVRSPDTRPLGIEGALVVHHKRDLGAPAGVLATSTSDPASVAALRQRLAALAAERLAGAEAALLTRARQRRAVEEAAAALDEAQGESALELKAESLRGAALALERLIGRVGVEDVLDDVFSRFCIGK